MSNAGHWMLVTSLNGTGTSGFNNQTGVADVLLARDVVAIAPKSSMRALYIVDNPSAWIVHCHIGKEAGDREKRQTRARPALISRLLIPLSLFL